jgi:hypothetical protein
MMEPSVSEPAKVAQLSDGQKMEIVTHAAILGRAQLLPGIQPVSVVDPTGGCLVAHSYPETIIDEARGLNVDVTDCTVYTVTHLSWTDCDLTLRSVADRLLEQSLQAISEVTIWNKSLDQVGKVTAFTRQSGRLDVKFFFIEHSTCPVAWKNPLYWADRKAAALMAGFLGNMIVENGPAANPISPIVRRVMAALDLINLGFYTESFVSVFALTDDLCQEVLRAGLAKKGFDSSQQKAFLRVIKEERLKQFVTSLAVLCGWSSLDKDNPALFARLLNANTKRNNILHGSARLSRDETLELVNTLLDTIDWLKTNPFGFAVPSFPLLVVAESDFVLLPPKSEV